MNKAIGWFLTFCLAMFIVAACQAGMFSDMTDKVKEKVPSVKIDK